MPSYPQIQDHSPDTASSVTSESSSNGAIFATEQGEKQSIVQVAGGTLGGGLSQS